MVYMLEDQMVQSEPTTSLGAPAVGRGEQPMTAQTDPRTTPPWGEAVTRGQRSGWWWCRHDEYDSAYTV